MNKTQARKEARRILAHGHFQRSATEVQVRYQGTWLTATGSMGRPPKYSDMVDQIATAIQEHPFV